MPLLLASSYQKKLISHQLRLLHMQTHPRSLPPRTRLCNIHYKTLAYVLVQHTVQIVSFVHLVFCYAVVRGMITRLISFRNLSMRSLHM